MSMTIGRASLSTSPSKQTLSGKTLTITFDLVGTDIYHFTALRQQLLGLMDNRDEEGIPYTNSEDATLNGFYRVQSVDIGSIEAMLTTFWVPDCTISLEQIDGYGNPWFEVTTQAVVRTNVYALAAPLARATVAVASTREADWGTAAAPTTSAFADPGDGSGSAVVDYVTSAAPITLRSFRFSVQPQYFYWGAAQIEVLYGSTWYKVHGRQIPRNTKWRITNGIVRLTSSQGATAGTIELWDQTGNNVWLTAQSLKLYNNGSGTANTRIGELAALSPSSVTILRNSPEQVTVQSSGFVDGSSGATMSMSWTLARGQAFVEAAWTTSSTLNMGPAFSSATAMSTSAEATYATAVGGAFATFTIPVAYTADLVNGNIRNTAAAASGQFAIAMVHNAASAALGKAAVAPFYAATSRWQRVVIR